MRRAEVWTGYAAHMRTRDFLDAVRDVVDGARDRATAVFCTESVWWRCHRRMIADFAVLSAQLPVLHLMHDGRIYPHRPMEVARLRADGLLVYHAAELSAL